MDENTSGQAANSDSQEKESITSPAEQKSSIANNKLFLVLVGVIGGVLLAAIVLFLMAVKDNQRSLDNDRLVLPSPPALPIQAPTVTEEGVINDDLSTLAKQNPFGFPEGSVYSFTSYTNDGRGNVQYRNKEGDYRELYIYELDGFEYISEDYVKYKGVVYRHLEPLQWSDPDGCTRDNPTACEPKSDWESLVSPYTLSVEWLQQAEPAGGTIPAFDPLCLAEGSRVGTVANGPMTGSSLYVQNNGVCDMWCGGIYFVNMSYYVEYQGNMVPVGDETSFLIADLATTTRTERIPIPGSSLSLIKEGTIGMYDDPSNRGNQKYLFTDPVVGDIYRDSYSCFVSERPDHVGVAYSLELPFDFDKERYDGSLSFTKIDGTENTEVYKGYRDYNSCLDIVDKADLDESDLVIAGTFSGGAELYKYADSQASDLLDLYNDRNTLASYESGQNKYSYEEFLSYNPYLYWKDPFGDWVKFTNRRFEIAAEKCKPVIYLYPEAEGEFIVEVFPNGGFTQTIPEYGDGWHVHSTPESLITDKKTGEQYPYLYWEGVNTGIPEITHGWIVAREEVSTFFDKTLMQLGLNENEISDFKEYWVDRLETKGSERYKIMFLSKEEFDVLSPLSVTGDEEPENIIRVMMYAQPAQAGETIPEQVLPDTPLRYGFTVVEWGGALLN